MNILHRHTGAVLYSSATAQTIADAVVEATRNGANLEGANLDGATLYGATLVRANLEGANLYGANLEDANLYGANLEGANLEGANLYGANLEGATLEGAKTSETTKLDRVAITLVGSRHVLTAYADRVRIGCQERSYADWLDVYERVGKIESYTPEQIEEYHNLILQAQAMIAARPVVEEAVK